MMALIGYARVSTDDQNLGPQLDALHAAGCGEIFEEHASGGERSRPQLAAALARVKRGDTLMVARIDRLARSLSHLLEVVESLRVRGAHFKSLADPIDTSGPSGVLVLQMLGAVAEFERSLIRERTVVGVKAARARGRVGGNPGLRARDPVVLGKLLASRRATRLVRLTAEMEAWMPVVRRLRPQTAWPEVTVAVNAVLPAGSRRFTEGRLVSSVQLLVAEGLVDAAIVGKAPRRKPRKGVAARQRACDAVAGLLAGRPGITLAEMGVELVRLGHRPPSGGASWAPASLTALLGRVRLAGLVPAGSKWAGTHETASPVGDPKTPDEARA
jgi:DNA invertase Pin-like site-specific DNA recombinase